MTAAPNKRERELAQELDLAIVEAETGIATIEEQSVVVQRLYARAFAKYRLELLGGCHG